MKHKHIHVNNKLQHSMISIFKSDWLCTGIGHVKVALRKSLYPLGLNLGNTFGFPLLQ